MLLQLSIGHNSTALLPHANSKIPPRYATSALTYIMGQALILEIDEWDDIALANLNYQNHYQSKQDGLQNER